MTRTTTMGAHLTRVLQVAAGLAGPNGQRRLRNDSHFDHDELAAEAESIVVSVYNRLGFELEEDADA